jgi:hypothetical protein
MKSFCINYATYPERAEENKQFVTDVFKELKQSKIAGIKYAAFKMGENIFIHLAQFETEETHEAFKKLPAFKAFQKSIYARLSSKPIINSLKEIGSFSSQNAERTDRGKN